VIPPGVESRWPNQTLRVGAIIARVVSTPISNADLLALRRRWANLAEHFGYEPPPGWSRWDPDAIFRVISEARRRFPSLRKEEEGA